MSQQPFFSSDYFALRSHFLERAEAAADLRQFEIAARGPAEQPLYIDIAWIGAAAPKRAFLHVIGTHGVEGYLGSTIQAELLSNGFVLPEDTALVFLHALNPWGMAHKRRVNEGGIDLNRNMLFSAEDFRGAPELYQRIDWFLNPKRSVAAFDCFYLKALYLILRFGFAQVKQTVGAGQYDFPNSLYFGGSALAESNRIFADWFRSAFEATKELFVVEVHSGLGDWGGEILFWDHANSAEKTKRIESLLGRSVDSDDPNLGAGFRTRGDLQAELPKALPGCDVYWLLQEFGAYGPVPTLKAMRAENADFQHADLRSSYFVRELVEVFFPESEHWRRSLLMKGTALAFQLITKALNVELKTR